MKLTNSTVWSSLWILTLPALVGAKGCALGNDDAALGRTDSAGAAGEANAGTGGAHGSGTPTGGGGGSGTATGGGRDLGSGAGSAGASSCPVYPEPACDSTQRLTSITDDDGCPRPLCWDCAEYAAIDCGPDGYMVFEPDEHGCPVAVCEKCPELPPMQCVEGAYPVDGTDANGCAMTTCESCPDIDVSCLDGEYIVVTTDARGCEVPECQPCPLYERPDCGDGEQVGYETDPQGCSVPTCVPGPSCYSPTQNLDVAYSGGVGCACSDSDHARCIDGVALVCEYGRWMAVADGPCEPSTCNLPLEVDSTCEIFEHIAYWHNAETGQCEPYQGGCPTNENTFDTFDDCVSQCQDKVTTMAVIQWGSCDGLNGEGGLGEQVSHAGDELLYERVGQTIQIDQSWGCGCATRPEFVLAYEVGSPLRLRLCHDDSADSCEALCTATLSFDLSQAMLAAGTDEYVFVD